MVLSRTARALWTSFSRHERRDLAGMVMQAGFEILEAWECMLCAGGAARVVRAVVWEHVLHAGAALELERGGSMGV